MNSFEMDMKRAVISWGFGAGLLLEAAILIFAGFDSDIFRISVPVLATFPYSTAWLLEYQSGYVKSCLSRTGVAGYILGKFFACGFSGGLLEFSGCLFYQLTAGKEQAGNLNLFLVFLSGMLWAVCGAVLAAWANNRFMAYGGPFVLYYLLVILYERYFEKLYCLYPYEWMAPKHEWVFGEWGAALLLAGMILLLLCFYYEILRRRIRYV